MPPFRPLFVAPLLCALSLWSAAAAGSGEPESPYLDDDLPVVLSMTRLPQRIDDAPGAVTLFTREDIERLGYRRLPQLLRTVPGMNVMSDTGHSPAVFYHGLGSLNPNRMQVLIDGRSVYSPYLYGYVDWDALPVTMDEIERIEVVRGANAATYGSNAVAGVVNIVTRTASDGPAMSVAAGVGNRDIADGSARLRRSFGPLSIALNVQTSGDQGFEHRFDDSRLNMTTLRADLVLNASDEINLMAGQSKGARGVGYPFGVTGNRDNSNGFRDVETDNSFVHLRFRRIESADNEWSVSFYRNEDRGIEQWTGDISRALGLPLGTLLLPIDYNRTATRQNLDFQHQFKPAGDWRVAWGAELRRDELESDRMFFVTGHESQGLFRVSANVEWRPSESWTFNLGNMIERFQDRSPQASPRLFATWHMTPQHAVKAGVSRAYRQPALIEERGDARFIDPRVPVNGGRLVRTFVGTPGLQPERLDAMEFGYVGQFGRSTLDVRVFHERYDQLVKEVTYRDTDYIGTGITFVEGGDAVEIQGVEYQYRYRGDTREIWFSHAIPRIASDAPCEPRKTCFKDSVPSSTWSLTWMESLPRDWSVSATLFGVNSTRWFSGGERAQSYQTLDARVARKFRSGDIVWEAAVAVTDIGPEYETFNDDKDERVPFNRVARQTRFTLRTSWF